MPAYKYTLKSGRTMWYAAFYYTDWTGRKRHVVKRGFKTQREAKEYETDFLQKNADKSDIIFSALVENYMEDMSHRLKPTTIENKRNIIDTKILPYFKDQKTCDIDTVSIRKWQNELMSKRNEKDERFSETYLKTINNQLSAIMNYAVSHYGLSRNPCRIAGSIGKSRAGEMNIWTKDQFERFAETIKKSAVRLAFEILFWTGIRLGELLALTPDDILPEKELDICKNYSRVKGEELILTPKTERGFRKISIPDFLYDELQGYLGRLYGLQGNDRIFYFSKSAMEHEIIRGAKEAGLPRIRIHDLRHSNASLLIEMGVDIMEISRRLGHESTKTTWDTYGHLYPNTDRAVADKLHELKKKDPENGSSVRGGSNDTDVES